MNNKYLSKQCSIDSLCKNGRTRLNLNEIELETYLANCVYIEELEEEHKTK